MKKYFNFLMVALFATMTLSLASCKDDNDEPDKGGNNSNGVVGELIIDGQKKSFVYITGETDEDGIVEYTAILYTKGWDEIISIETLIGIDEIETGMSLTEDVGFIGPIIANTIQSGNIHVDKKTADSITLTFNKTVFKEINGNATCTVEGTIKLPIDGEYGDLESSLW